MLWHICFQKTFCIIFLIVFLQLKKTEMNATIYSEHCCVPSGDDKKLVGLDTP